MRAPMAKGLRDMFAPAFLSISKVSRALWPTASMIAAVASSYAPSGPSSIAPVTAPSAMRSPLSRVLKRTSPPRAMISSLIARTMPFR